MAIMNSQHSTGNPLYDAAKEGCLDTVTSLLQQNTAVNAKVKDPDFNYYESTALHVATKNGHENVVLKLLQHGADVNMTVSHYRQTYNALHLAIKNCHTRMVEILLQHGADIGVRIISTSKGPRKFYYRGFPLHVAAAHGCKDIIMLLLQQGADVNVKNKVDDSESTPLHIAAKNGHKDVVKLLLQKGASVNEEVYIKGCKYTPLYGAAENGNLEIFQLLLQHGADINVRAKEPRYETNLFLTAAERGHKDLVMFLIEKGADVNEVFQCYDRETTALHAAAGNGSVDVVETLLKNGADINVHVQMPNFTDVYKHNYPVSALNVAVDYGQRDTVDFLIKNGLDINNRDSWDKSTLLHLAADNGDKDTAELLLEHGIKTNVPNNSGHTALDKAVQIKSDNMIELLFTYGENYKLNKHIIKHLVLFNQSKPPSCPVKLSDHWDDCKIEVDRMKLWIMGRSNVSLYTFLNERNPNKLAAYISNEEIQNGLENEHFSQYFPTYSSFIKCKREEAENRQKLLSRAELVMNNVTPALPALIRRKILSYLRNYQIVQFLKVYR